MKLLLSLFCVCGIACSASAGPIQVTAQCTGAPVQEAVRATFTSSPIQLLSDGKSQEMRATLPSGKPVTLEVIREYIHPTILSFSEAPSAIKPGEFVKKQVGLSVTVTASQEEGQIIFHGTCTLRRPASLKIAQSTTPQDQPCVTASTFITRECDFAGRSPVGAVTKIDLGEQGVDVGELLLTFNNYK